MAANTYILESGSTFNAQALTSAVAFSYDIAGSPNTVTADGSRHALKTFVDGIQASIRVECLDQSLLDNASLYPGKVGILALKCKLRTQGSTTSTVATCTFSEATFISASNESPQDGTGRVVLTFIATTVDDDAADLFSWA